MEGNENIASSGTERLSGVKSALRVLEILEFFARTTTRAALTRISAELDMPKSSCHALMETLRNRGYVYWLGKDQGYYPTRRWRDLGEAITKHDPILSLASPVLHEISDLTGETAIIAKQEGTTVLYLEVVEPNRTLRFTAYAGQIKPMHSAASGRALLALLPPDEREQVLAQLELCAYSPYTVTDLEKLRKTISEGERLGYHVAIGEYQPDTTAIATGFRFGSETYALLIGGPTLRLQERIAEVGTLLVARAKSIAELG